MRNSQDYPLQIDFVSSLTMKGRIGMTFCPGKKQHGAMTGDWDRDLVLDLEAIRASGASVLINLMEDHEMVELGVADTAEQVPSGIDYLRMPIPDVGIPRADWEQQWLELGDLRSGFRPSLWKTVSRIHPCPPYSSCLEGWCEVQSQSRQGSDPTLPKLPLSCSLWKSNQVC
ncbi:MAG: hypothetical protein V7746_20470 [Halioglobus sp.]